MQQLRDKRVCALRFLPSCLNKIISICEARMHTECGYISNAGEFRIQGFRYHSSASSLWLRDMVYGIASCARVSLFLLMNINRIYCYFILKKGLAFSIDICTWPGGSLTQICVVIAPLRNVPNTNLESYSENDERMLVYTSHTSKFAVRSCSCA